MASDPSSTPQNPGEAVSAAPSGIPKKATVRITLPPKPTPPSAPAIPPGILPAAPVKKETVRIEDVATAKDGADEISPGSKKDTIRINLPPAGLAPKAPAAPPSAPKPPAPPAPPASSLPAAPAPKPPGAPLPPPPGALSGMPKPPGSLPTMPPVAPSAPAQPQMPAAPAPAAQKPVAPKKETTRITLPPSPRMMPKATVKLNQTVPLANMPAPALKTADIAVASTNTETTEDDPLMLPLSIVALIVAIAAIAVHFL